VAEDPSKDAYLWEFLSGTNFGAEAELQVKEGAVRSTSVMFFDISNHIGKTLATCDLNLTYTQVNVAPVDAKIDRLTQEFEELGCSWNEYDIGLVWPGGAGAYNDTDSTHRVLFTHPTSTGAFVIDVMGMCQNALDKRLGIVMMHMSNLVDADDLIVTNMKSQQGSPIGEKPNLTFTFTQQGFTAAQKGGGYMAGSHAGIVVPPQGW